MKKYLLIAFSALTLISVPVIADTVTWGTVKIDSDNGQILTKDGNQLTGKDLNQLPGQIGASQFPAMTGEVTNSAGSLSTTVNNSAVIGKNLTGFNAASGTVTASDTILSAFNKVVGNINALASGVTSVFGRTGAVTAQTGDYNTSQVTENTNLYFTDERAQDAVGSILTTTGRIALTYNDILNTISADLVPASVSDTYLTTGINANKIGAGAVSNTEYGYLDGVTSLIQGQLDGKQGTLSLTTTGSSGAATLVGNTLNIPNYATGGSSAFNALTSGTNTTAAMVVGTGATLGASGSGTIAATSAPANALTGTMTSAQLAGYLTNETGSGSAVFGTSPTITGASVNGVTLDATGSTSLFLNQAGTYTAPSGSGAVDSVNGQTGTVVLDTGDIDEATNKNYVTDADLTTLGNTSGVNTGDQTITLTGDVTGSGTGSFATAIGTGVIVNADVNASAGIGLSKLAATTASRALVSDGSGFVSPSTTTATEIGYLGGATSNIQNQIDDKQGSLTLTTTGSSGVATLVGDTLNIPNYAAGGGGDVSGPSSSTGDAVVRFDGISGKIIQDSAAVLDDSGNLTATSFIGPLTGNADTATALETARTINGTSFDGTANITVTAAAGTLTGSTLAAGVTGSSLTSVGTIGTGTWNGSLIAGQYGGTGVNNSGKTITLGGNLTTSGAHNTTLTTTGATGVTLPTTGTLATLAGAEALTNKSVNGVTLTTGGSASDFLNAAGSYVSVGGGTGTVTEVSVASANGFAGTVADDTTTPEITMSTTVTGLLKGNGTAITAATSGTDYSAGTSALATGILKSTTTTGALTIATAGDFPTLNQNTTGSAATLTTPRTIGNVSFNGSANIVPETSAVIDASADTTTFPAVYGSATGNLQPLTDAGLTYNASTNALTTTTFIGALTGNASTATSATTATNVTVANEASDTTTFPLFATAATGDLPPKSNTNLAYNSSTGALSSTSFVGALSGNATTATALATGRTIAITGDLAYTSPSFTGAGNVTAAGTLATVNSNVGSFGSSTSIPSFTVNGKGLITAASGNAVVAPAGTLTGSTLASGVTASSLTSTGTLTGGATGSGFTVALGSSTITGDLPFSNIAQVPGSSVLVNPTGSTGDIGTVALSTNSLLGRGGSQIDAIAVGSGLQIVGSTLSATGGGGDVSAASNIGNNLIVVGDGGAKGVKQSGVTIDTNNDMEGVRNIYDLSSLYTDDVRFYDAANPTYRTTLSFGSTLTANRQLQIFTGDASRSMTFGGNITTAGDFTTSGANALTLTTTGTTNVTLPTSGTLLSSAAAVTVPQGGTGATTLTGIVKGNGTSAFTAATAGTDYVTPGTATTFTAQQNFGAQSLTDAATITWNAATQQVAKVTLTSGVGATRVLGAPSNLVDGGTYILRVTQSATGNNALTYNAVYKWPGGVAPVLSTANNAVDILTFISDGTNMYGVAQKSFQ